jgi:glycosyltransferase involved in cell wall biosynthesis
MYQKKPFFAVVIPVYNKGPHVHRAVNSVLNQSFHNFKLILVNDGSTDNSLEEMKKFRDPRISIFIRNNPGPGGYAARNLGIKEARSEWVAFLDADDEWYPEHLEKMHDLSNQFSDVYFLGSGWRIKNDSDKSYINNYFIHNSIKGNHLIDATAYLSSCLCKRPPAHTISVCIKLSSPVASELFPADMHAKSGGDLHAWLKMICYHKKMAWSAHIGAIYHRDSVNMVTKTAPRFPHLMKTEVYNELSTDLNRHERKLLQSYLNMRLRNAWVRNFRMGNPNFNPAPRIFWGGNILGVLKLVFISLISFPMMIPAFFFKRGLKK